MAILKDDTIQSDQGFHKTIDEAGLGMVMDNLQRFQYQYPIKSTVREIASNAVDSHKERDIAKSILLGESQVADHYVEREGALFEASKFNQEYYNIDSLSDEKYVRLEYLERDDEERDLVRFIDAGVGLGGARLEGFFSLSYSTKRLNKSALGKFGIGAKAPLSTGVPSYRMVSTYNGERFVFDIFSRHIQSIVERWDSEGNDNIRHEFANGYSFYSEKTSEKNGVTIELEVKKHQRSAYKEAVQNQLLYFSNIKFEIHHNWRETEQGILTSWVEQVPVSTEIIFENEDFIISNNGLFTRPHLVLGAEGSQVNYGLIDFKELELNPRTGNIGIKVDGSEIEITPSRESVVWSPQTRDVILLKFEKALQESERIVNEQLNEPDILKWIDKNISLWSSTAGSNPVLKQLSGMIDKTDIKPTFMGDTNLKFGGPGRMLGGFATYKRINFESKFVKDKYKTKVLRVEEGSWGNINPYNPLFFAREGMSARKDAYIKDKYIINQFYVVSIPELDTEDWEKIEKGIEERVMKSMESLATLGVDSDKDWDAELKKQIQEKHNDYAKALKFLEYASQSELYKNYDDIVVPAEWVDNTYTATDELIQDEEIYRPEVKREYVDHAARRKQEGKVFFKYAGYQTPYNHDYFYRNSNPNESTKANFGWTQKEEYASVLNDFDGTLVYGLQTNTKDATEEQLATSDEAMLRMVAGMLLSSTGVAPIATQFDRDNGFDRNMSSSHTYTFYPGSNKPYLDNTYIDNSIKPTKDLMLLKVSKNLAKELTHFLPVSRFLLDRDNDKIFTHMKIANWFTAKQVYPLVQKLQFLANFKEVSPFHAEEWKELYDYTRKNHYYGFETLRNFPEELHKDYVNTLDNLFKFQRWVAEKKPEPEEIAEYSLEHFKVPTKDAYVVDLDLVKRAEKLFEWAEPIIEMMNNIPYFTTKGTVLNNTTDKEEFLESIRFYLRSKSVEMIELEVPVVSLVSDDELDEDEDY